MGFWDSLKEAAMEIPLKYIGGHPDLQGPVNVGILVKDNNLQIRRGGMALLSIPKASIINVTMEKASKLSAGKMAGGAIVGGLLAGPIGAIAGGALGATRRKDDSVIIMSVNFEGMITNIVFGGDDVSGKYGRFVAMLR